MIPSTEKALTSSAKGNDVSFFQIHPLGEFGIKVPASISCRIYRYCRFSKIPAAPMPPPIHMETIPYFEARFFIS